jgi:photosystem II stability/assembly factor-like uncharacterized protein
MPQRKTASPARAPSKERNFFYQHVAFPMRDASPVELEYFWSKETRIRSEIRPDQRWECLGPYNVAGRVTSLAIHPEDHQCWVAGSAAGGVWLTTDAGQSWRQTWSRFAPQSIGALSWVQWDSGWVILAATGEANMSADTYPGSGFYVSLDKGLTWVGMFGAATPETSDPRIPRRVGCLAPGPRGRVAVGSVFLDETMPAGLYFIDFRRQALEICPWEGWWGARSYNCHSVLYHPDGKTLFAALEPDGTLNGIWRSPNGGKYWEHLTRGLPRGDFFRRTSLAMAPSDPDVIYALAANRSGHILGVFRTTNGGRSWKEILHGRFERERHMDYNNAVAVHPRRPDSVVIGGMKLHRSDDGGRHWRTISTKERGEPNYVHDDHHVILWPDDDILLSGNDGGVSLTEDGGRTWRERSRGMVTSMFYDVDVAPTSGKIFAGGAQDNGTLVGGVDKVSAGECATAIGGDGAWVVFHPTNAETAFASSNGFDIRRHSIGQPWTDLASWEFISPAAELMTEGERGQRAFTVLAIDPSTKAGPVRLWAGSARLWWMDTKSNRWGKPSPIFDGSPISAIEIAAANPRVIFVGTSKGGLFRSRDRGRTWTENLAGPDIPSRAITSIRTHPRSASTVLITLASTGVRSSGVELRTGNHLPYGHVFRSYTGGDNWDDLDQGHLPNVAYFASAYETHPPYRMFVGGDVGVWAEHNGYWLHLNGNLPNVVVSDLVYHHRDRTLTAATYGRGLWRLPIGPLSDSRVPLRGAPANMLRVDPGLTTPVQRLPVDGAVVRRSEPFVLAVEPVPGAAGYQFEIVGSRIRKSVLYGSVSAEVNLGKNNDVASGKWRVSTIQDGLRSRASRWRRFVMRD